MTVFLPEVSVSKKITIVMSDKAVAELEELQRAMGGATFIEVIREALRVLDYIVDEYNKGNYILPGHIESLAQAETPDVRRFILLNFEKKGEKNE